METERKIITFSVDLIKLINDYAKDNFINTFTGAVNELVRKGLESSKKKNG